MKKKYDVIVCGGGFAGSTAAISAARGGAKVLLIEKCGRKLSDQSVYDILYKNRWKKSKTFVRYIF